MMSTLSISDYEVVQDWQIWLQNCLSFHPPARKEIERAYISKFGLIKKRKRVLKSPHEASKYVNREIRRFSSQPEIIKMNT